MPGVTSLRLHAEFVFDDGFVVTVGTPVIHKNVRMGWYFDDELAQEAIGTASATLVELIGEQTLAGLYKYSQAKYREQQNDMRQPRWDDPFSLN